MSNGNFNPDDSKREEANSTDPILAVNGSPDPIKTADPKGEPNAHVKSRLFIRIWHIHRKRQQRVAPPNVAEKITVFLIFVTAAIGGVQARIYYQQKRIMESSGRQTDQLIEAANIQALASRRIVSASRREAHTADKNAEAAESFSASADKIREETAHASAELHRAANDSETASKLDQRAWFGISDFDVVQYDPDDSRKPFRIKVLFRNSGKTPARQVHVLGQFQVYKPTSDGPNEADWNLFMGFFNQSKERYVTAPDATRKYIVNDSSNNIITQNYQAIKDHLLYAYYFGLATYVDNDNRLRTTRFCLMLAEPETKQLAHCGKGNDMD